MLIENGNTDSGIDIYSLIKKHGYTHSKAVWVGINLTPDQSEDESIAFIVDQMNLSQAVSDTYDDIGVGASVSKDGSYKGIVLFFASPKVDEVIVENPAGPAGSQGQAAAKPIVENKEVNNVRRAAPTPVCDEVLAKSFEANRNARLSGVSDIHVTNVNEIDQRHSINGTYNSTFRATELGAEEREHNSSVKTINEEYKRQMSGINC